MTESIDVLPFSYAGELHVPYSKSYLQRAIAIATLGSKPVEIHGFTPGNDALAAMQIAEALGGSCSLNGQTITVVPVSSRQLDSVEIHCGESGLSTRMFAPIAASLADHVLITGEGSIVSRPMNMVVEALEKLGAKVASQDHRLPLRVEGKIQPGTIEVDASESSQVLTGLLIALSFLPGQSTIRLSGVKSIPYIQMTLDILKEFGVEIPHEDYKVFYIPEAPDFSRATDRYEVEGDWSGASFHVVGAALSGSIELEGLSQVSAQADRAIVNVVRMAGANAVWKDSKLRVSSSYLKSFTFDATNCPDLFPPVAALAVCCEGVSEIVGVSRLASKESNRGLTIQSELKKLGIRVDLEGDLMRVHGGKIHGGTIDSCNDHRIAMMGAILATKTEESITIANPYAVNKSYPNFFDDIQTISKA